MVCITCFVGNLFMRELMHCFPIMLTITIRIKTEKDRIKMQEIQYSLREMRLATLVSLTRINTKPYMNGKTVSYLALVMFCRSINNNLH